MNPVGYRGILPRPDAPADLGARHHAGPPYRRSCAHDSVRRRIHVPRRGPRIRGDRGAAARPGDGRGGAVPAGADPQVLRARPDGHRGAGAVRRRRRRDLSCRCWPSRRWRGSTRRPPSTSTCTTPSSTTRFLRWGNDEQQARYFPRLTSDLLGAFALSEPGSGSDAFALATRAERKGDRLGAHRPEVLDHQRRRGRRLHRLRQRRSRPRATRASPAFIVERDFRGLRRRQEGEQARHPRLEHDRADPRAVRRSRRERARARRPGLQDRDRDAERRADRHRRADDRRGHAARSRRRRRT